MVEATSGSGIGQGTSALLGTQQQGVTAVNNLTTHLDSIFIGSTPGTGVRAFSTIASSFTTQVLPANASRATAVFHNPSSGPDIFVAPTTDASSAALSPTVSALGGTFRVFGSGGTLTLTGQVQTAWVAFSSSGTGNSFTTMESNTR